jgi:SprT protein
MTQAEITTEVENAYLIAERYYNRTFIRPRIIFKRNGTTAGYATRDCKTLMFQLDLAEHNKVDFITTVKHEVAHAIQFALYPRSQAHGYEWKFIMQRVMGIPADRCHEYDVSVTNVKRQTRHEYECGCGKTFNVSQTMHNKILRGSNRICGLCRTRLTLKKVGNPYEQKLANLLKQLEAKTLVKH